MDLAHPYRAVADRPEGDVLVALSRAAGPLTGREVSRRANVSQSTAARVLARLVLDGLVERVDQPPTALYSLNRKHVAAGVAEALAGLRTEMLRRLRLAVEGWLVQPVAVAVFGSFARGEGGPESDVDILVVRPDELDASDRRWEQQLSDLEQDVLAWTGNPGKIVEYGQAELEAAASEHSALVEAVAEEGLSLAGPSIRELTRQARWAS